MPGCSAPRLNAHAGPRTVADLHLHSRFSMSTSRGLSLATLASAAREKGIDLLATGDFTHPAWFEELSASLVEAGEGVYETGGVRFVLGTEVSCIWPQAGRGRRVHLLVFAPGFDAAAGVSRALAQHARLESDGRPMLKLPARDLAALVWDVDAACMVIPAHIWTPWYGAYGSKSGFDSLEECFGDMAAGIHAIETGLSSDPAMNWLVPDLDERSILSFSDAHSAANLGRELTLFAAEATYPALRAAMEHPGPQASVLETVEFHPEHGKYHYDGHRKCGVSCTPAESRDTRRRCPQCGRPLTLGVLHRAENLGGREIPACRDSDGLVRGPADRPPFRHLVPLRDILSQALGVGRGTKRIARAYTDLVSDLGGEYRVLTEAPEADIEAAADGLVASTILAARAGRVEINPGYDGVYGTVTIKP